MELSEKTISSLDYLKCEEWLDLTKPEELIEKQVHFALDHVRKGLDYLEQSFQIINDALFS